MFIGRYSDTNFVRVIREVNNSVQRCLNFLYLIIKKYLEGIPNFHLKKLCVAFANIGSNPSTTGLYYDGIFSITSYGLQKIEGRYLRSFSTIALVKCLDWNYGWNWLIAIPTVCNNQHLSFWKNVSTIGNKKINIYHLDNDTQRHFCLVPCV